MTVALIKVGRNTMFLEYFPINLVTLKGFEPLLADPESAVLPLNYRVTIGEIIASEI